MGSVTQGRTAGRRAARLRVAGSGVQQAQVPREEDQALLRRVLLLNFVFLDYVELRFGIDCPACSEDNFILNKPMIWLYTTHKSPLYAIAVPSISNDFIKKVSFRLLLSSLVFMPL